MQTQKSKIDTGKALDADLVDTGSIRTDSTVQDDNNRSGNDTDDDDADIRPIYDEEPMAEVQLTAECNIFAIRQQHTKQPEIINEGRVYQYPEKCQVKSPMLDSSPDNQTTEYSKQSLESENILLKKTVAQFQKDFSRMEAHCIALELKYQNQALKSGQHGQIMNETCNRFENSTRWFPPKIRSRRCCLIHIRSLIRRKPMSCKDLDVSASTSINVRKEQSLNLSASTSINVRKEQSLDLSA
ncbi:hypothetical protein Tco_1534252, partial [Tanacetum coccineum]